MAPAQNIHLLAQEPSLFYTSANSVNKGGKNEGEKERGSQRVAPGRCACLWYTEISLPNKLQIFKLRLVFCILLHHASLLLQKTIKHQALLILLLYDLF